LIVSGFLTSPWDQRRMFVRGGEADAQLIKEIDVRHVIPYLFS
jgi:hypothetical protein